MQRGFGITQEYNIKNVLFASYAWKKKRKKETEKQQYIIVIENNLFKGFTTEGVWNYD